MKAKALRFRKAINAALFVLLLSVAGLTNALAQSFTEGILNYTVNSDGVSVTVTGLVNGSYYGAVNIPNEVTNNDNTYSVTTIATSAFQNCTGITSATIPSSVISIGNKAFRDCSGLITLNYNAVNCSLGSYNYYDSYYSNYHWLYGCSSLVSLNIGQGVQAIPDYFVCAYNYNGGGSNLTGSIAIPNSVTSIGRYAFAGCYNIGTVTIGNSVTSIGENAFYNCSNMGSLTIGSSVASIGVSAFESCSKLTTVVLPSSMTSISNSTFSDCSLLSSVTIPNTIVSIGSYAFYNTALASVAIPNSVVSISEGAFYNCSSLASVSLGESVASIGASAFYGCSNLATLVIPNSVVSIGNSAFYGCSYLSSAIIGDAVFSIGSSAFYNCTSLTSVSLGSSVASIGNEAFHGCTSLPSITIPASVTSIGTDVFGGCTALGQITVTPGNTVYDSRNNCKAIIMTSANKLITGCKNTVIPNTVTVIGNSAFYSCTGLSGTLSIPNSVITIESNAFYGCTGLTGLLNIPNSVTTIATSAFQNCTGITSATIPSNVISIGNKAFRDCSGLITLNYNAVNCSLGSYNYYDSYYSNYHWLYGCSSLVSLNIGQGVQAIPDYFVCAYSSGGGGYHLTGSIAIPNSVTSIGRYAFAGCYNIGTVTIGNSVTSIGENAFYNCSNMGSLTIGSSVASIGESAFSSCSKLTTVVLPTSLTSISNSTFSDCSLLSSVTIPNTIVSIGSYAFYNTALASVAIPNSVVSISEGAFYNCSSLASVSIGESVASIGGYAFYGCSNIASMSVYADNPPVVLSNAFSNISTSIPVQIPCGTLSAYQSASVWNSFTNLQEMDCLSHTVTVTANPTAGGTLTGGGSYTHGTSCTVTATANDGYTFLNWQENGQVVSTDAVYTFNVMGDRDLVARFLLVGNHWTPESANYSENMGLYGVIQIDGIEQRSDMLEVGAFCGNECRGTAIASLFDLTNRYLAIMTIFGDDADPITFKLYDHDTNQELELSSPEAITFNIDGYGTPVEPYVLNFVSTVEITATINPMGAGTVTGTGDYAPGATCTLTVVANDGFQFTHWTLNSIEVSTEPSYTFTVTGFANYVAHFQYIQTRSLVNGWNWYSTYIEQNGINGLEMLENSLGAAGVRIQGRNGIVDQFEYQGNYSWYGTLNNITNEQMYKIRTNAACNAVMTGNAAAASSHPITINSGWNWIGFPSRQSISVATAVSGFMPEGDDVIKGRNGFTTYIAGTNIWYGTLNTLEPGQGYMYKSNSSTTKTLVFNTGRTEEEVANVTPENNIFVPNDAEFADNMLITAVVDMNGEELYSDEYELAAFVGDECRGSVKLMYVEPIDRYVAFLTVFGESNDDLHFVVTNGIDAKWSSNMIVYSADAIIGTLSEPATIHFGTTGLNDDAQVNAMVYPNPSNGVFNIKCEGIQKVEVMNIYGQMVVSMEVDTNDLQIDLGDKAEGAYMLRIITNNGVVTKNLIKNN